MTRAPVASPRRSARSRDAALALLLGAVAAAVSVPVVQSRHDHRIPVGDRVLTAAAELREDRVHVAPDGRALVDEATERRLEEAAADVDPAAYVVVWGDTRDGGFDGVHHALDQLAQELGDDAAYLIWEPGGGGAEGTAEGRYLRGPEDGPADVGRLVGDPETRITEWLALVDRSRIDAGSDEWGGVGGGITLGVMLAGGGYLALMLVVNLLRLLLGRRFVAPGTLWTGLAGPAPRAGARRPPSPAKRTRKKRR